MTSGISRRNALVGFASTLAATHLGGDDGSDRGNLSGNFATGLRKTPDLLDYLLDRQEWSTLATAEDHDDLFDRFIQSGGGTIPWLGFPWRLSRRWTAGQWPTKPGKMLFEPAPGGEDVVVYQGPLPNTEISERWGIFEPESGWIFASSKALAPVWVSSAVPEPNIYITQWRGKSEFTVRDINGRNMGAHRTTAEQENYNLVVLSSERDTKDETCSRDFRLIRCGNSFSEIFSELRDGGISIVYSRDGKVIGGSCVRGNHGVMLWGGDARTDGLGQGHDWRNQRKCLRISVVGFNSSDVQGAFCWGSMAEQCEFINCTGEVAGDVGFDWEGSLNCIARGCMARDAKNGNYTCFFHCDQIKFTSCLSFVTNADFPLFRMYTESNDSTQNRSITIDGGTWTSYAKDKTGSIDTAYGCCRNLVIKNIKGTDCTITTAFNNMAVTTIIDNHLVFTKRFPAFSAIRAGFSKTSTKNGETVRGQTTVKGNSIVSLVEQAGLVEGRGYGVQSNFGSAGIDIIDNDSSHASSNVIESNAISDGFLTPLLFRNWSTAPGIRPVSRVSGNTIGAHSNREFRPMIMTTDYTGNVPPVVIAKANKLAGGAIVNAVNDR